MKNLKTFENYEDVNGEPNYIGGVDGIWASPDREQFPEFREGQDHTWVTVTGDKIPVSKMSVNHLRNTLNAIIEDRINFKNIEILKKFTSGLAKIRPKKRTGVCSSHQRKLSNAIKRARYLGLLPYTTK